MGARMRLLFLCPFLPVQGMHAGGGRMFSLIKEHSRRHSVSVISFVGDDDIPRIPELERHCERVIPVGRCIQPSIPWPSVVPRVILEGFESTEMPRHIRSFMAEHPVDAVTVEYVLMSRYLPPGPPSVLVVHEFMTLAAWREWRNAPRRARTGAFLRMLKTLCFEERVYRRFDRLVALTRTEMDLIRLLFPWADVTLAPMGADGRVFFPRPGAGKAIDLLFVGNFFHPPNVDAMRFFCGEIFPAVLAARPETTLSIVGYRSREVLAGFDSHPNVSVEGRVPDLTSYLARSKVFINPVRLGSGMRGKVVEAMAMGRPVVSTSVGADGLDAAPGKEIVVADEPKGFARALLRLLGSEGERARVGSGGRALFERRYDWRMVAETMERLYAGIARRGGGKGGRP